MTDVDETSLPPPDDPDTPIVAEATLPDNDESDDVVPAGITVQEGAQTVAGA
jgi:hypothetical protein